MNAKHTPGPWHVGVKQAEQIIYNSAGWAVANATVYHGKSDMAETKANARLIAAAPDLLAALEDAISRMERAREILTDGNPRPECNWGMLATKELLAAIAKARGE